MTPEYKWPNGTGPAKRLYICAGCGAKNFGVSIGYHGPGLNPDCAHSPECVEVIPAEAAEKRVAELEGALRGIERVSGIAAGTSSLSGRVHSIARAALSDPERTSR